ncbi:MAG TPA: hypothetical protein VLB27_11020 [candidate division Zixibacteria bacterium]|nr:hypothetical protein [candidate division Zixibacteria bacterium]
MARTFPLVNSVVISGEIVSAPRERAGRPGESSVIFYLQTADVRAERSAKARVCVIAHDALAVACKTALNRGDEALVEGVVTPSGSRGGNLRVRAVRVQARAAAGAVAPVAELALAQTAAPKPEATPPTPAPAAPVAPVEPAAQKPAEKTETSTAAERPAARKRGSRRGGARRSKTAHKTATVTAQSSRPAAPSAPSAASAPNAPSASKTGESPAKPSSATSPARTAFDKPRSRRRPHSRPKDDAARADSKPAPPSASDESPFAIKKDDKSFDPFLIEDK